MPRKPRKDFTPGPAPATLTGMIELMRTHDPVVISVIESLLRDAGIEFFIADQNMSIVEGSLGILPRRVMIDEERAAQARALLADAGVGGEIGGA